MGAVSEFFGFEGRISRLGYLWRMIALGVGGALLSAAGATGLTVWVRPLGLGEYERGVQWLTIVAVLLALWSSVALATRRLRDMGLEPTHIVPLYGALWVVNVVLLQPISHLRPDTLGVQEATWIILQGAAAIPLLFWPGRPASEPAPAGYEPTQHTAYLNWRENG